MQRLHDLDALLDPDRQVLHESVRVDGETVTARKLEHVLAGASAVEQAEHGCPFHPEHDVLGNGEDRHEHEVLVDHAYPGSKRVTGVVKPDGLPVEKDLPLVGLEQPVKDVHQRRLAGSVLAEHAWFSPGSTVRSMLSLATRLPKRFVIPRNSS